MYGIFTYIYHTNYPNVGKHIPYMDGKGNGHSSPKIPMQAFHPKTWTERLGVKTPWPGSIKVFMDEEFSSKNLSFHPSTVRTMFLSATKSWGNPHEPLFFTLCLGESLNKSTYMSMGKMQPICKQVAEENSLYIYIYIHAAGRCRAMYVNFWKKYIYLYTHTSIICSPTSKPPPKVSIFR